MADMKMFWSPVDVGAGKKRGRSRLFALKCSQVRGQGVGVWGLGFGVGVLGFGVWGLGLVCLHVTAVAAAKGCVAAAGGARAQI